MVRSHTKGLRDAAGMEAMPAIDQPWWRRKPSSSFDGWWDRGGLVRCWLVDKNKFGYAKAEGSVELVARLHDKLCKRRSAEDVHLYYDDDDDDDDDDEDDEEGDDE